MSAFLILSLWFEAAISSCPTSSFNIIYVVLVLEGLRFEGALFGLGAKPEVLRFH